VTALQRSAVSRRRRRRRLLLRRAEAVLVVLLLLGGAAFAAWWFLVRDDGRAVACPAPAGGTPAPVAGATPVPAAPEAPAPRFLPGTPLPARHVTVTVLNATERDGLARTVTGQLARRGFRVGEPANDPLGKMIVDPAEVRFGPAGAAAALSVAAHVPGAVPVVDGRADARVDLVLGEGFESLRPRKEVAAAATPVPTAPPLPRGC
jgi:LytR cell envelope-related transcriptional attenuator